ncbi:MAG: endonuclease NucS domain-containing protein [Candidatus Njordarchaeales archaeon]
MRARRILAEEDLHKLFFEHPYLLINTTGEEILEIEHEYLISPNSIVDLYIKTNVTTYLVEIKDEKITKRDVMQALKYKLEFDRGYSKVIIVGYGISQEAYELAQKRGIQIMIIGREIPSKLKVCDNCRKAYNANEPICPYCNNSSVMETILLL